VSASCRSHMRCDALAVHTTHVPSRSQQLSLSSHRRGSPCIARAHAEATRDPSAGPQLERELEGHKGAATAVAFLPGGGPLVSGGADGTVRVWNSCALKSALHNRKGFVYRGHTDAVTAVDCSPDGSLVASASKDRKVRLWNPGVDGRAAVGGGVIKGHGGSVRAVNFSDDGASLLTASDDKTIKIWSMPEMRFMHALTGHTHWVRTAAFDPGHSMVVVSGGDDKTVRIWHMPRKNPVQTLFGHTAAVNAVAFNPDGFSIASASVRRWQMILLLLLSPGLHAAS
jgi:centriolar protein POC1